MTKKEIATKLSTLSIGEINVMFKRTAVAVQSGALNAREFDTDLKTWCTMLADEMERRPGFAECFPGALPLFREVIARIGDPVQ